MDSSTFLEMVNMIGFPIAACVALFWMNREQAKYYREMLKEFTVAIDGNTRAINRLLDKVEKE